MFRDDQELALSYRCRRLNTAPITADGRQYVLCWLQQTLRGENNPVIDAALALGNSLQLPVVVYHGLGERYPHASDRLHQFILEASYSLEQDVAARGIRFHRAVERVDHSVKGLVYQLASHAAAVMVDDLSVFVGRWQAARVAAQLDVALIAVDAARLIPENALGGSYTTTRTFRARVNELRDHWGGPYKQIVPAVSRYSAKLATEHDSFGGDWKRTIAALVQRCNIDHTVPAVCWCSGTRQAAMDQLNWAAVDVIPRYASRRNNPAQLGVTWLSPYLHFGVLSPLDVLALAQEVEQERDRWKFLDELLVWREFFHHNAYESDDPTSYLQVPAWARTTLAEHADDPRPELYDLDTLIHGRTGDETWNAAQRQFLIDGWMHNNLRMYWGKRLIEWTTSPEVAWSTACYLNDRFSLDGRDPATYGNLRWCFGAGRPAAEKPVFGTVSRKSDRAMRARPGMTAWLHEAARRVGPDVSVPKILPRWQRPQASGDCR